VETLRRPCSFRRPAMQLTRMPYLPSSIADIA
jgi:hypothetical protein